MTLRLRVILTALLPLLPLIAGEAACHKKNPAAAQKPQHYVPARLIPRPTLTVPAGFPTPIPDEPQ